MPVPTPSCNGKPIPHATCPQTPGPQPHNRYVLGSLRAQLRFALGPRPVRPFSEAFALRWLRTMAEYPDVARAARRAG